MPEPMTAGDLCTRITVTASRSMEMAHAARLMREQHVGCLVVVDDMAVGRVPVGMLTDRDIVTQIFAKGVDPRSLRVEDVMSPEPAVADESETVLDVLAGMRRKGVRRLPVVDARGVLQGILTLDDVLEAVAEELDAVVQAMRSGRAREVSRRP
jgi:CBS domain-containing protein